LKPTSKQVDPQPVCHSERELKSILVSIPEKKAWFRLCVELLATTGLRISEVCNIKLSDVDLSEKKIYLVNAKNHRNSSVHIPERLCLALSLHVQGHAHQTYLFESTHKTKYTTRRIQQMLDELGGVCGVRCNAHSFRSTFLSRLVNESNLSEQLLIKAARHSNSNSLKHYISADSSIVREAVNKL
jgi:integrase